MSHPQTMTAAVTMRHGGPDALGTKMLGLARDRANGAYPYLVTPAYVRDARAILGQDRLLAVLVMVIPTTDREVARRAAGEPLGFSPKSVATAPT